MSASRVLSVALVLTAFGIFGSVSEAGAQASSDALMKRGKMLWINRGCDGCHAVGKRLAGPDLAGLEARRSKEWIVNWLKNTNQMLMTDSTAIGMMREFGGARMPQQHMTDQDIEAILAYIRASEARMR